LTNSAGIQDANAIYLENHIEFCCANAQLPPNKVENMASIMKQGLAPFALGLAAFGSFAAAIATPAVAQEIYRQKIEHDPGQCGAGSASALLVTINGVKNSDGMMRVQSYRGIKSDWLKKGKWIYRIEAPAREGSMTFCMPLPGPGEYAIAVRHDTNNNGKTDLSIDGGAMSNNPYIGLFNLGKPSYKKTRVSVGDSVKPISINMKYRSKD
jgi:uncharacterized protein (DUF2141 family)